MRGHPLTMITGSCYLASWMAVEVLSLLTRGEPLGEGEREKAEELWANRRRPPTSQPRAEGHPLNAVMLLLIGDLCAIALFCWPWTQFDLLLHLHLLLQSIPWFILLFSSFFLMVLILIPVFILLFLEHFSAFIIGLGLSFVLKCFNIRPPRFGLSSDSVGLIDNWIALRTLVPLLQIYILTYEPCRTYRPGWLEWLP
jgi:hypothetical protein